MFPQTYEISKLRINSDDNGEGKKKVAIVLRMFLRQETGFFLFWENVDFLKLALHNILPVNFRFMNMRSQIA